jgi:uncharacterized protein (TIGR00730 family)
MDHFYPSSASRGADAWRVFRIVSEVVQGFEAMETLGPSVAIFGSSQMGSDHPYYKIASQLALKIVAKGLGVITGGGPGIMQAANEGAHLGGGRSCGLCIDLPTEEPPNPFIDRKYLLRFRYFFVRKVMFVRYAQAFVILPGGLGTMDELFESLTLIQTHKIQPFPVYLIGTSYWSGLIQWLKETVAAHGCIPSNQVDFLTLTDDLDQVVSGIEEHRQKVKSLENF